MKHRLNPALRRPAGQVLVATLIFFFIFTVLFAALYRSGIAHTMKARVQRGTDLTALSCGAVYADGMRLVRHSNGVLLAVAALDLAVIANAYVAAGGPASGPVAVAAALAADPKNREKVQRAQALAFGIASDGRSPAIGLYPLIVSAEAFSTGGKNALETAPPLLPLVLFNHETSGPSGMFMPHLGVRFRTADELLPDQEGADEKEPLYRLRDGASGEWRYFRADQVEPAPAANTGQMRVRCDLPSPYHCKYVQNCNPGGKADLPGIRWALKRLGEVLKDIRLDVTHRDEPPCHTVLVYAQLDARPHDGIPLPQISEALVTGQGLAAWDEIKPRFRTRLKGFDPQRLPLVRDLVLRIPPDARRVLGEIQSLSRGGRP